MLADDYQDTAGYNKEQKLADIERGGYQGMSAKFDKVEFVVNGDTVTITFELISTDANSYSYISNYTNVWMKRDGQWQLVTSNWR
jgi:hypothetical protein